MAVTQKRTARQELAYIERRLFKGAGLDKASRLKGEERRTYKLAQVDRLLAFASPAPLKNFFSTHASISLAVLF